MISALINMVNVKDMVVFSSSTMEKLKIKTVGLSMGDAREVDLKVPFNPEQITITKKNKWSSDDPLPGLNCPDMDFGGGSPAEFELELYFDTTDDDSSSSSDKDVRRYTNELFKLTLYDDSADIPEPPAVEISWGSMTLFPVVAESVEVTFTLFYPDGTPARAKAKVKFLQYDTEDDTSASTNPTTRTVARKTRIIQQGDRLDRIAYEEYGHPGHWRFIAEVNGIQNPLDLHPGQIINLPPLNP